MNDQLVTFETAKIAKHKGFRDYSSNDWHYDGNGCLDSSNELTTWNDVPASSFMCDAPTQCCLQKWLRNKDIHVWCKFVNDGYEYYIGVEQSEGWYSSYEEALENGLKEALNLIYIK